MNAHICDDCFALFKPMQPAKINADTHIDDKAPKIYLDHIFTPFKYAPPLSSIVLKLKYADEGLVAELMAPFMKRIIHGEQFDLVVPVPLSKSRRRERGFNQAELLAKAMGFGISQVITRIRKTSPQVDMTDTERRENQRGSFALAINNNSSIKGKRVLVIDDIITSGATTNEIARILKKSGATYVAALAIARTSKN